MTSSGRPGYKIRPSDVVYILQCPDSDGEVAKRLGVSRQAVNNVRLGVAYRRIAPQLPRRTSTAPPKGGEEICTECQHWTGYGCAFGFPEPLKDLRFAQECSMHQLDKEVKRIGAAAYERAFDDDATP